MKTQNPAINDEITKKKDWLFDAIMMLIEPELATAQYESLDKKYPRESAEEKRKRLAKYDRAFAVFDEVIATLTDELVGEARARARKKRKTLHTEETYERAGELEDIEKFFPSP